MGRVLVPYGVRGWIKVRPYTQAPEALAAYGVWWLAGRDGDVPAPRKVVEARVHGATLIAQLEGLATREDAAALNGATVSVRRSDLPDVADDEVYVSELQGLDVVSRSGDALGKVADVQEFGAHPVLRVVSADGGERLIPFVPAYVREVDLEAGRIEVDWEADY